MKRQSRRKNDRKKFVSNIMNFVSEHVFKKRSSNPGMSFIGCHFRRQKNKFWFLYLISPAFVQSHLSQKMIRLKLHLRLSSCV